MSQCAGTDFRTGLHLLAAFRGFSQLGRDDLTQTLFSELPAPSTQADADATMVTISRAEMMLFRRKVQSTVQN
jgi:hypothetical protein